VWLLIRGLRIAVVVTDQHVTVRGWLRSRLIPRTCLRTVTGHPPRLPAVTWIDQNGRTRTTPLLMFIETRGESPARLQRR